MSDIFISYARPDRERARGMAEALEQRGWSVWWDHEIPPGRNFDDVIEEALGEARCVVVLWSQASIASGWVRNEASEAMQRQVLIPALIDADVKIPLGFRRLQAADLSRWNGESSVEFEQFCEAVARNVGAPKIVPPSPPGPAPSAAPPRAPAPPTSAPAATFAAPLPPAAMPARPSAAAVPAPAPARAAATRPIWLWLGGAFGILVLAGIASVLAERDGAQPTQDRSGGVPPPAAATPYPTGAGFNTGVMYYDYALVYRGTLSWDGRANAAELSVDVVDGQTNRSLGHRNVPAYGRGDGPNRNIFSAQIPVPGDSKTPGAHVHDVNLVFERQPAGNWVFVRNCMGPGNCYEVGR
jgi:hypothetical protein